MKSEALMEVDTYNLTQAPYINSEDGNSYTSMDEQLNISCMEKVDNEYLLPHSIEFEDADASLLQTNLEVLTSQVLDNNELLLYDKTRLRQGKRHFSEHLCFDYCKFI